MLRTIQPVYLYLNFVVYLMTLCLAQNIPSKDRVIRDKELERMWKETVVVYFKVISQNLPRET
jgi:hypothetical protein